jgi:glucose/arabinose dehydrogenase
MQTSYLSSIIKAMSFVLALVSLSVNAKVFLTETVVTGIDVPWGMVQLPDQNFLVTDRAGTLYYADLTKGNKTVIKGLPPISDRGQGGLMDIALHPDYQENGWIYLSYSSSDGKGRGDHTAIIRGKLKKFALTQVQRIYKASPNSTTGRHYGSRLAFDNQNFLYFSIGDRGDRDNNPQDLTRDGGKIYRLHDDGRIPKDNPFANKKDYKAAIFSYGHRNPQGMALNPSSGQVWTHEHGPKGGDEINIISKGKNYGWPVISYGVNYIGTKFTELTHQQGMEQPIWYWVPSIAPSGMTFVTSDKYPEWQGQLLVGSLKFGYVVLCKLEGNKVLSQRLLLENIGRVRNVKQMPDGFIYIATENNKIVRVIEA